jgi:hypothetical protein
MSALLDIHAWQARNDNARAVDQQELNERLTHLETNQQLLMESLSMQLCSIAPAPNSPHYADAHQRNMMAMMVSLQRRLQTSSDEDRERQFFTHALQRLTTASGRHVEIEEWMITSYEVEFGHEVGSGGLYVSFRSCGRGVSTNRACYKWTSIQRQLEQDAGGAQGAHGGGWCNA